MCTRVDNQWSHGVVIARLRSSVWSLLHQRRDLHQSSYLYLAEDWNQPLITWHLLSIFPYHLDNSPLIFLLVQADDILIVTKISFLNLLTSQESQIIVECSWNKIMWAHMGFDSFSFIEQHSVWLLKFFVQIFHY
jgi:hypothetical protein